MVIATDYSTLIAVDPKVGDVYVMSKHFTLYTIDEQGVTIAPWLRASRTVGFADMAELAVVQGMLARRFHCGTVFLVVKSGRGACEDHGRGRRGGDEGCTASSGGRRRDFLPPSTVRR